MEVNLRGIQDNHFKAMFARWVSVFPVGQAMIVQVPVLTRP
jgi:hypothetical protein